MNNLAETPNCSCMPKKIIRPRARFHTYYNFQNTTVIVSFHRIKLLFLGAFAILRKGTY
jgi:hypothetical protein